MPNWCQNILDITGPEDEARKLRALVATDQSDFDFEAVVPMPPAVRAADSSSVAEAAWELKYGAWDAVRWKYGPDNYESRAAALQAARDADHWGEHDYAEGDHFKTSDVPRSFDELADAVQECLVTYGHRDPLDWAIANWGTKWNACGDGWLYRTLADDRGSVHTAVFATAWTPPVPLVIALSTRFPRLTLRLFYEEPDTGFRGFIAVVDGNIIAEKREEYSFTSDSIGTVHVSHIVDFPEAIYVGDERRAPTGDVILPRSKWANPFTLITSDQAAAARLYQEWIEGDPEAAALVPQGEWHKPTRGEIYSLLGHTLACWCRFGKPCHCRVIVAFALDRVGGPSNE